MRQYRAWVVRYGRSEHLPIGDHPDVGAAFDKAFRKFGERLVSVRSIPTPDDPTVERKVNDRASLRSVR